MSDEPLTCDVLKEAHQALLEQGRRCSRFLVTKGPLSEAFIEAFYLFEERKKELKALLREFCLQWIESLPTMEITREYGSIEEYRETLKRRGYLITDDANFMLDNECLRCSS